MTHAPHNNDLPNDVAARLHAVHRERVTHEHATVATVTSVGGGKELPPIPQVGDVIIPRAGVQWSGSTLRREPHTVLLVQDDRDTLPDAVVMAVIPTVRLAEDARAGHVTSTMSVPHIGLDDVAEWRQMRRRGVHLSGLGAGVLYRGRAELAHMSQVLRRDLTGEEILLAQLTSPECRALGHSRPAHDQAWVKRLWNYYRFIVDHPGQPGFRWVAFRMERELRDFAEAYALQIDGSLEPGEAFHLLLPGSADGWQLATARPIP